jgi:hypothetical protein
MYYFILNTPWVPMNYTPAGDDLRENAEDGPGNDAKKPKVEKTKLEKSKVEKRPIKKNDLFWIHVYDRSFPDKTKMPTIVTRAQWAKIC